MNATGFDTFQQALDFIREHRGIANAAEKATIEDVTDEQRADFQKICCKTELAQIAGLEKKLADIKEMVEGLADGTPDARADEQLANRIMAIIKG